MPTYRPWYRNMSLIYAPGRLALGRVFNYLHRYVRWHYDARRFKRVYFRRPRFVFFREDSGFVLLLLFVFMTLCGVLRFSPLFHGSVRRGLTILAICVRRFAP